MNSEDKLTSKEVDNLKLPNREDIRDMTFLKDSYDESHGTSQIIFTTLKTQSFKCYRISNAITSQFNDSKDIK